LAEVDQSAKVRIPYYAEETKMLAKMTAKNQLTLPKSVTEAVGSTEYFQVETRNGQIILTPVRIQRAGAVRAKLAELGINEKDIEDAVAWARRNAKATTARRR
jgi:bifunctional DNA-binding transcriptional regulator/antitoxin component of YhaV-PrlF toxin-antitoxin module